MDFFHERDQQYRQQVPGDFHRFLFHKLNPDDRCSIVYGLNGTGKTTLLLQLAEYHQQIEPDLSLFISADDLWLHEQSLFDIAENFYLNGGRYLLVDDLHKYPEHERDISQILEDLPELHVIGTSVAELSFADSLKEEINSFSLPPLSFREYLEYRESIRIDPKKLGEIVSFQKEFSEGITGLFQPIPPFRRYLAGGTLFPSENKNTSIAGTQYGEQRVNELLETSLPSIEGLDYRSVTKIKRLLALIIHNGPLKPNISDIARYLDVSRDSVYSWLSLLEHTGLIFRIWQNRTGNTLHRKPDIILPSDPSMLQFAGNSPQLHAVQMTFLISQLQNAGFECKIHKSGAVYLNGMTIGVGEKNDPVPEVSDGSHPLLAADNLEVGTKDRIPLWIFGLLY
jgi:predicted AAA+ superfamily ATPase